jgi:hypothetical protein
VAAVAADRSGARDTRVACGGALPSLSVHLVKKVVLIAVVVCAASAGSWYDYQPQVLLILGVLPVYAVMAPQFESLPALAALKLTATTIHLQAYIGVTMLAGSLVSRAILASTLVTLVLVPSVHTLLEEGFTGSRRRAAHPTPARA